MRLAYITTYDARDITQWSGLGTHIARALENQGHEIEYVGPLNVANEWLHRSWKAMVYPFHRRHLTERQPDVIASYAAQVSKRLADIDADVVLSPGSIPVSLLDCDAPVVFWTDAPFAALQSTYPEFRNILRESREKGDTMEQEALTRSRLAIYSSDWAAQYAIDHYKVDPAKVKVVPFGANIDSDKTTREIETLIESRPTDRCVLLFLGVEWHRKGGDIAVDIATRLNESGQPTELHVVGCTPPEPVPDFVKVHGHISKSDPNGQARIEELLSSAHFLVQPSRAECYGVAFAEASAHGVPSLASNVGGIGTVVRNEYNGRTFSIKASADDYADFVQGLMADPDSYRDLALRSHRYYRQRLNWDVAGASLTRLLEEIVDDRKAEPVHVPGLQLLAAS